MTQEEKYIMSRTVACLASNMSADDYQSELLIKWSVNNEQYKRLNVNMRDLIGLAKTGEDITEEMQNVYEAKEETSGNLYRAQEALDIPEEFLKSRDKTEEYVFMQMHIRLAVIAPDDQEPQILLAWSSANYQLKNVNKKLSALYAKGKKYGFQTVADEYNEAKRLKEQYTKDKDAAVSNLERLAKQQQRNIDNFPLRRIAKSR